MRCCVLKTVAICRLLQYLATLAVIPQIIALLAVGVIFGSCALKPKPAPIDPLQWYKIESSEKQEILLEKLDAINRGLVQFKGKGKLYVYKKGKLNIAERLYWICAEPDKMRLALVASSGMPLASFASDGKWFYIRSHTNEYFSKKPLASANLDAIISIPVSATDIIFILSGRIAITGRIAADLYQNKSETEHIAVFKNSRKNTIARVHFDQPASRLTQIERFDPWGYVQYKVTFNSYRTIGGYHVPYDIMVENGAQYRAHLKVFNYWPHPSIDASVFNLNETGQ